MLGVLGVLGSAFFVGVAAFSIPFIRDGGPWRAPSLLFALGALLVLVEIISAQVVFSQVGNVVMAVASSTVAWRLRSRPPQLAAACALPLPSDVTVLTNVTAAAWGDYSHRWVRIQMWGLQPG